MKHQQKIDRLKIANVTAASATRKITLFCTNCTVVMRVILFKRVASANKTPVTEGEKLWKAVVQSKKEKGEVKTLGSKRIGR